MKNNDFFDKQSDLTNAKIKIYEKYIESYLIKLLMTYDKCLIVDLFCGPGKNGDKSGSPLILLERLKYILTSPILENKGKKEIFIIFNDEDPDNIENLKDKIKSIEFDKSSINIQLYNEKYENILPKIIKKFSNETLPKFFFLDPFSYSNVKMKHLQQIMSLSHTEVLLFNPIFHSYRFTKAEFKAEHKTRMFIEEFTFDKMTDYGNVNNFLLSMKKQLKFELGLKYVRPVLIDGGEKKNTLILLTKHKKGMLEMNRVAFGLSEDGNVIKMNFRDQDSFFDASEVSKQSLTFSELLSKTLENGDVTNYEILDFAIEEGFLPKHAKSIIENLIESGKIKVYNTTGDEVNNKQKWYISESPKAMTNFKWNNNETN